ncbi:hypothetical protein BVRB_4g084930 [Beta vulgaris subsp. vulgaris]|nr:hypothetical protein BVRB_4g084930 [Beta vulgaris subsp. vulgaris]
MGNERGGGRKERRHEADEVKAKGGAGFSVVRRRSSGAAKGSVRGGWRWWLGSLQGTQQRRQEGEGKAGSCRVANWWFDCLRWCGGSNVGWRSGGVRWFPVVK